MHFRHLFYVVILWFGILNHIAVANERPLIGILLNSGTDKSYSIFPWYAIRKNYSQVIVEAGGLPVFISHDIESLDGYLQVLDGILLTGGEFGVPDEAYTTGIKGQINPKHFPRSSIEFELIKKAYAKDIPLLGICAGMQNMNAAMGGTLYHNLLKSLQTTTQHRIEERDKTQHSIEIAPKTKLFNITGTKVLDVNSNHHGGIRKLAAPFKVSARAPDGVIEGLEAPSKRFFMGVMWHPEFQLSNEEKKLWKSFVQHAKDYHQQK